MKLRLLLCAASLLTGSLLSLPPLAAEETAINPANADRMDWPHWRGPEQNGISRETGLIDSWSPKGRGGKGENLLWKRDDLAGRSTPIVMRGRMYTIVRDKPGTPEEGEKIVCVDAATGKDIWERRWNVFLSDVPDTRIGWASAVGDPTTGNVYAQGVNGFFQCFNGETGETLWSHSMSEEYGILSTYGGRTNFPILHGNLVVVSGVIIGWGEMAQPAHRFVAFDKRNGQAVWFNGTAVRPEDTTYSTPVTANINGQPLMIFGSSDGAVHAMQPLTGKIVWSYLISPRGINTTPLVVGNTVYCGHSEENLIDRSVGAVFALDATKTGDISKSGEIWQHRLFAVGKSAPIMVDGKIVAVEDSGNMLVIDPKDGKEITRKKIGTMMTASPVYADGKIYVCAANGRWYILKLVDNKLETVHQLRLNSEEVHSSPVISHGRIYLQTMNALYCIGKEDSKPSAEDRPPVAEEAAVDKDTKPAQLQLVPVESLLKTGQKQQFQVRLYNATGQFLKSVPANDVKFSIQGPGKIGEDGRYESAENSSPAAVAVTAEWAGSKEGKPGDALKASARIRVIPPLPWKYDFEKGDIPVTWVGIRYRHVPIDFELFTSLRQRDPAAAQLYIYLTTSFTNSGRPTVKYDNSTPAQMWTEFLRFMRLLDTVTNL
ncbi:MAG: PQQ-binding-like beta-propeller repeat protein, partial [Planctomycetaceae bacterium]